MNKLLIGLIASVISVVAVADTDVVNKKVNEKYTNNPEMHQKVENTRGNSDGYYEHPNSQQLETTTKQNASQVKSNTASKVSNAVSNQ